MENSEKRTAFSSASFAGHLKVMKAIIKAITKKHGIEKRSEILNKMDKNGESPLYLAACEGHAEAVDWLLKEKEVEMNCTQMLGRTALHGVAEKGHLKVAKMLLESPRRTPKEKREYLLTESKEEKKAVDYAKDNNHLEVIEVWFFSFFFFFCK